MSSSFSWLEKIILRQERQLRKEYEGQYLPECEKKGVVPLVYAAWRHQKKEREILELLLEESELNQSLVALNKQGIRGL